MGTTTVASLLASAVASQLGIPPRLIDHSGGDLITRVTSAAPAAEHWIRDLGPRAVNDADLPPDAHPVIVTSSDPNRADAALAALQRLTGPDKEERHRGIVVVNSTSRRRPPRETAVRLSRTAPGVAVVALAWDPALATPGPVDPLRLSSGTIAAVGAILRALQM